MDMPTMPDVNTADPQAMNAWANVAQQVYNQAKLQGDADDLAFRKAQAALGQAMNYAGTFGYAPGGNWQTWGPGGPSQPIPGTSPLSAQQQWFSQAGQAA